MRGVLGSYLLAQVPGWMLAGLALWGLQHWEILSPAFAGALLFIWICKDLLLFPVMRRFYEPTPVGQGMIGQRGTVVTALDPEGLVRVRGELWKARSEQEVTPGTHVRVREVHGLTLLVVADAPREPD